MEEAHDHDPDYTAAADGVEETGSSFTWESQFLSRVNAHQTLQGIMPSLMEGATSMQYGIPTECAVTIVKETGVFEKLLMEKLSAYMCPIIGISSLNGWLLVHFWEGDSYAVDLGALSPGSKQGKTRPGAKIAGGTPDNIHKWAIIHSVGRLLSDDSILKVVYDVLHVSHDLGENAGLKIVRVFDVLEADRIIRGHSFLMPLSELLQIYGMEPNSCVDIVIGSQKTPVVDDPLDYCGKSQRQAINNLREMSQVSSKMIPLLYQAMLSIMSAPMLAELNQRSNASVQSPQQLDCWYNPRRGDKAACPENIPSHPSSYAAALEGMAATGNESTQQAPCLVQTIEAYTEKVKYDKTEVQSTYANVLQGKTGCLTENAIMKQAPPLKQLQECIQTSKKSNRNAKRRRKKKNKIEKESPPQLKSNKSGGNIKTEQNQMPPAKIQNDVKPKKSSVTSSGGPANPQEQTGPSKSPLSLGVPVGKEKNQLKVKVQNDVKTKESRGIGVSGPAKTKEQPKQSKSLLSSKEKEKGKMPQHGVQNDVKRKNNSEPKTKEQSYSSKNPFPKDTVKKEQNTLPQQKAQNGAKPKKSSVTSDKTSAKTSKQNSSSKSCPSPGATNKKGQNQMPQPKVQNDKKAEKNSVTSASGPVKAKEQPSKQDKHQQKQQENFKVSDVVKAESKKKKEPSQKSSDKPSCVAKTEEQNSSSKSCPSPGATNKKVQNQMPQPKVQNDKKAEKNSEIGACGLANTKDQASSSKSSHTPREVVKKEQIQMPQPKVQNDKKAENSCVTSASGPVKAKEQPSKQDKHQQKQQENSDVNDAVKAKSKKKKEPSQKFSDKPAVKTEKEHITSEMSHHRQRPTLFEDCPAEKRESDASTSSISSTEQAGIQEQKDFQKNDQVLSNTTTKPKGLLNQQQNAEKEDMLVQLFQDAEDMLEQVFQDAEDWGADVMTSLAHTPQQHEQQNTNVQQQHHQTHQQQQQNTNVQQQHHQTHQQQQQNTNVQQQHHKKHQQQQQQNTDDQQQHHQTHQQQQQNTNVKQQHHQTHQQQQQNTNVQQVYQQTHQQQQQQNTNVQQQYHQTHQQQQQQNTNVQQQYYQIHHQQQQNTNVQQQYYQIHQQQQQITKVPILVPGIIPQIPMGLMLQAQTLPPQQVTVVQWAQQQWVKTSPETKLSTSPQWMKPMVLQFEEGNNPVFIHPLSEQASIPINPCLITDEQDEEFDDLILSDVTKFVEAFPASIQLALQQLSQESYSYSFIQLAEVVLDVGRKPKAWYLKSGFGSEMMEKVLNHDEVTKQDLKGILEDNSFVRTSNSQAMVRDTLHRLGLLANLQGEVIGITAKVEHPLPGCLSPLYDIFNKGKSILVVGPTGAGKTTLLREAARVLSDVEKKNVIIIDTLSEIAGEGDIPHQSIGSARRLQVIEGNLQHKVMSEAYQNHRPEIVIIDEISSLEEAEKTLDMKLRGIQLIAGVQGKTLADVLLNTALTPITGGIKESVGHPGGVPGRLRTSPVVFDVLVEMLDMERWIIHWDLHWAIDMVLPGGRKTFGVEERKVVKLGGDPDGGLVLGQQVLAMRMSSTYNIYTQ